MEERFARTADPSGESLELRYLAVFGVNSRSFGTRQKLFFHARFRVTQDLGIAIRVPCGVPRTSYGLAYQRKAHGSHFAVAFHKFSFGLLFAPPLRVSSVFPR